MFTVGMRKYSFGLVALVLLWVLAMWAPDLTEGSRDAAVNAMWLVTGLVVGGIMGENIANRKAGKAAQP